MFIWDRHYRNYLFIFYFFLKRSYIFSSSINMIIYKLSCRFKKYFFNRWNFTYVPGLLKRRHRIILYLNSEFVQPGASVTAGWFCHFYLLVFSDFCTRFGLLNYGFKPFSLAPKLSILGIIGGYSKPKFIIILLLLYHLMSRFNEVKKIVSLSPPLYTHFCHINKGIKQRK